MLLSVSHVSLLEHGDFALSPITFDLVAGRKLAVAGESGAGKSTLLQIIAGLIQPTTGEIRIDGGLVRGPAIALVPGHPGVAYLSQKSDLPKFLRVEQVLRYASQSASVGTQALAELCRISHLLSRRTDQLSGGEQQRVALARLLLGGPKLLLLDEPFSNLDRVHKQTMQAIIEEVGVRLGITCVLVSHDAADMLSWADEIMVLHRGKLVQQATPTHLYRQPVNTYTAGLFGDYNLVRGQASALLAPSASGGPLLVRPEHFRLGPSTADGLNGSVRAVRFFGSYYEIEVQLASLAVRVRASEADFAVGTSVGLSIVAGGGWHLAEYSE